MVFLDFQLLDTNEFEVIRKLIPYNPDIKVLIVSTSQLTLTPSGSHFPFDDISDHKTEIVLLLIDDKSIDDIAKKTRSHLPLSNL